MQRRRHRVMRPNQQYIVRPQRRFPLGKIHGRSKVGIPVFVNEILPVGGRIKQDPLPIRNVQPAADGGDIFRRIAQERVVAGQVAEQNGVLPGVEQALKNLAVIRTLGAADRLAVRLSRVRLRRAAQRIAVFLAADFFQRRTMPGLHLQNALAFKLNAPIHAGVAHPDAAGEQGAEKGGGVDLHLFASG